MRLCEVYEGIDTRFEKRIHAAARGFGVETARVFTCKKAVFFNPVGFDNGKFGH
jgi:N-acetylglutamate synthase-like GNAT family acetyltransferase